MERNEMILGEIAKQGLIPLFYNSDKEVCIDVARALYDAGIRLIEFTNRGPEAFENFKALLAERDASMPGLLLAIGTIRTADQASRYINAGADFLISPVFDADICDVAYLHKKVWIPGCMTPTEVHMAEKAGCKLVKLFPGNVLGPGFVSGIKELFPEMHFMPTGGVELDKANIEAWFKSGVIAVGIGSKLITKEVLVNKNYMLITKWTKQALDIIAFIKR